MKRTGQNVSTAVMQRRVEPPDSLDYFPTPPWATRALCEVLARHDPKLHDKRCWEPACGEGHMARPLAEYFERVYASDCHDYGHGAVRDFLFPPPIDTAEPDFDWIVTNPPFRLGAQFALTAIDRVRVGVALLVRTAFLEGDERWRTLFAPRPPALILQFCERVPMVKGRVDENAVSATAYCWVVWNTRDPVEVPAFGWIPKSRRQLEPPGDYDA